MPKITLLAHFILCGVGPAMSGATRGQPTQQTAVEFQKCREQVQVTYFKWYIWIIWSSIGKSGPKFSTKAPPVLVHPPGVCFGTSVRWPSRTPFWASRRAARHVWSSWSCHDVIKTNKTPYPCQDLRVLHKSLFLSCRHSEELDDPCHSELEDSTDSSPCGSWW